MPESARDHPLSEPRAAARLVEALREAGLDAAALEPITAGAGQVEPDEYEARTAALPPLLATAVRLFVLGLPVPRSDAQAALGSGLEAAEALRAVVSSPEAVQPTLRIVPHDVLFLASDIPSGEAPRDHVADAHSPSLVLARLTVRARVDRALDLGTGNGIQALLLSRHAKHVVATDLNERALRFTEFNAALNGCTNIETRHGSFFEPVRGERFGAVACSPPYVISPESRFIYRDADVRGDELSEQLIREVPAHLEEGGFASILVSWVPRGVEPEPIRWTAESGCDVLTVELHRESALEAARAWHEDDPEGIERWLDYYRREDIEEIAYGAVVLRRREGSSWRETLALPAGPASSASDQLVRIFEAPRSTALDAPHLHRFAWAPDVVVEPEAVVQPRSLGLRVQLDEAAARVVRLLSPSHPAGAAFDAAARELHRDRATLRPLGGAVVRDLVALGLLVPLD